MKKRVKCFMSICIALFLSNPTLADPVIKFIENKGQWPGQVHFSGNLPGGRVFFERNKLRYNFYEDQASEPHAHGNEMSESGCNDEQVLAHAYSVDFINSNHDVEIITGTPSSSVRYNYYVGDKSRWASGSREYDMITYANLYDGIDLVYKQYMNSVKYDFVIREGSDPHVIALSYSGLDGVRLTGAGLELNTSVNQVIETHPIAYQWIDGVRQEVRCHFSLFENQLRFEFPDDYDPCYDLTIDPQLIFSTYSGSTSDNWGNTATFDKDGNLYSGGITNHYSGGSFPATVGAYQTTTEGLWDTAILKYDSTGTRLIYATYLGGASSEVPQSMVVNDRNELYVMGTTGSDNFPTTTGAYSETFSGGTSVSPFGGITGDNNVHFTLGTDIFVSKFNATGSDLLGSTFYGGSGNDGIEVRTNDLVFNYGDQLRGDIFLDENDNVLIASRTNSTDFPILDAIQTTFGGGNTDGVVFKLSGDLQSQVWSTYFGGTADDAAYSIKTDSRGFIIIGGGSTSANLSSIGGFFTGGSSGNVDGWVAKFRPDGLSLSGGVYVGGSQYDQVYFIDVDTNDDIYTYGQTAGDFPDVGLTSVGDGQFIQKHDSTLTSIEFSRQFGSANNAVDISPTAFLVSECDKILISGWGGQTNYQGTTTGMSVTADAFQRTTVGNDFYMAAISADGRGISYATFLGGSVSRTHVDGGTSRFDERGIVYHAVCAGCGRNSDFPTTPGAHSRLNRSQNCNNAAFKFDLVTLDAIVSANSIDLGNPGLEKVCLGEDIIFENFSAGGQTFFWDLGDGTKPVKRDKSFVRHTYTSPGFYKVKLRAIDPTTCVGEDIDSLVMEVINTKFEVRKGGTICVGDGFRLSASGAASYVWTLTDGTPVSTSPNPIVSPTEGTEYRVLMLNDICEKEEVVFVSVIPDASKNGKVTINDVCLGRPTASFSNSTEDDSFGFLWLPGDGTAFNLQNFTHSYDKDGVYSAKLITTKGACVNTKTFNIIIKSPRDLFTVDGATICQGDQARLAASGASSYEWFTEDEFVSSQPSLLVEPEKDTKYYVRLFQGTTGACSTLDSVMINVIPSVEFDVEILKIYDCFSRPTVELSNSIAEDSVKYVWTLGDGSTSTDSNFSHDYESDGAYAITLTGKREDCEYQVQETVSVSTVRIPNIITPGASDGKNDTFVIESESEPSLKIFNRWGKIIFEMDNYDDSWDGSDQSAGVYYYEAIIFDGTVCSGWVQVVR